MAEPPLSERELTIVRGMIDDHLYEERRRAVWAGASGLALKVITGLSVAAVLAASIKGLLGG